MEILPQLLVNALIAGSIYALIGSGLSLCYGLLRVLNFAHGHLMMVGAYCFYLFSTQPDEGGYGASYTLGWSLLPSSLATFLFSIVFAIVILYVFILPFQRFSFLLTLVATIALASILEALISMSFGVNVKSLSLGSAADSIEFHGIYITPIQLIIIGSAIGLLSAIAFVIHSTSLGRKLRALSENSYAAQSLGISKRRASYSVFIVSTLLAVYAGVLVGYETNMQPTMGISYTIKAFAAMILGGLGNLWGTVIGSYILGLVENLSIGLDFGGYSIPAGYKDAFAFMIILLVLLFKPQGLFRKAERRI